MNRQAVPLDALEVASGLVYGHVAEELPQPTVDPKTAFRDAVRDAVAQPPCFVSFSGGRDSSAVLAVAADVARSESLPPPIPVTNRFATVPASREDEWQERVIAYLRLDDWIRLDFGDELDNVGPYARRALLRHGLLWPFNAHFHLPVLEVARGGSLLTGIGGDEVLGEARWARALDVLACRNRPTRSDVRRVAAYLAPRAALRARLRRRAPFTWSWLLAEAQAELTRRWASQAASEPRLPRAHARWRGSFRYQHVGVHSLALLAADEAVRLSHPFLDQHVGAAVAAAEARLRFRSRTEALADLVGRLLPQDVLTRQTKSSFDGAFFTAHSRSFASSCSGIGIDASVVDADLLRAEWLGDAPDAHSFLALQAAWLASSARQPAHKGARDVVASVPVPRTVEFEAR